MATLLEFKAALGGWDESFASKGIRVRGWAATDGGEGMGGDDGRTGRRPAPCWWQFIECDTSQRSVTML